MSKFIKLTVIGTETTITNVGVENFINVDHIVTFNQLEDARGYFKAHTRVAFTNGLIIAVSERADWIAEQLGSKRW